MPATIFEQCFAALMVHEVGADPLDPSAWSGRAIGAGQFICEDDGLDMSREDSGNWTGGAVGVGTLGGTRYGIDTASYCDARKALPAALAPRYPALVRDLTLDQARELTRFAYWKPIRGDELPPAVALMTLDAAFNNGVGRAARWLQEAAGTDVDGDIGDGTMAAVRRRAGNGPGEDLAIDVLAERMDFMAKLPTWRIYGFGWSRRLARLPFQAARLSAG